MRIEVALCLPGDARTVAAVRRLTVAALAELGVTEDCLDEIRLAISEACSNVIEHAEDDDEYEVRLEVQGEVCEIKVIDRGHGFDATALSRRFPTPDAAQGRGIALMHALMDHIDFDSHPERGTMVHLTKKLSFERSGVATALPLVP